MGQKKQGVAQYSVAWRRFNYCPNQTLNLPAIITTNSSIKRFLILCHNQQYTVRVDEHQNGEIRYLCWQKPKSFLERPSFTIRHGKCTESPGGDKEEYVFQDGELTYTLERIISKGKYAATHIFLEVTDGNNQKSTWKMQEKAFPRYLGDLL